MIIYIRFFLDLANARVSPIFVSQTMPLNPFGHEHVKLVKSADGTQDPPFRQRAKLQGFFSRSHLEPEYCEVHLHSNCPFFELHFPLFLHGAFLQGSEVSIDFKSEMSESFHSMFSNTCIYLT